MSKVGVKFDTVKEQLMMNAEFRIEYDKLKPRYEVISQIIKTRNEQNVTQGKLAYRAGTKKFKT